MLLDRAGREPAIRLVECLDDLLPARGNGGHRLGGSVPSAALMSGPSGERRSGLDRRRSNWRDATETMPPTARDALALRRCVEVIRGLVAQVDDLTTSPLSLRSILDSIELAIVTLDEALRPSG